MTIWLVFSNELSQKTLFISCIKAR